MVRDAIISCIAIADAKVCLALIEIFHQHSLCKYKATQAYHKLVALFKQNLAKAQAAPAPKGPVSDSVTVMTQDLLLLVLPYLSPEHATALFDTFLTSEVLESWDSGVQKRGYKILARLIVSGKVQVDAAAVFKKLEGLVDGVVTAAKDRFQLLSELISVIRQNALHLIPSVILEAVLGTKELSEKARNAAFDLAVVTGQKMAAGGVAKRQMLEDMDAEGAGDGMCLSCLLPPVAHGVSIAASSVKEYLTIVCGGLAGASPDMISATVTAVSRLLFEFEGKVLFRETIQTSNGRTDSVCSTMQSESN